MLLRNRLKVHRKALGLLDPFRQIVLSLMEDSGSASMTVDDLISNGFGCIKIPEALQELQWPGLAFPVNGRVSGQRWCSFQEVA